ncbi:putative methyltransferase DDB_G0268948 [Aplysia californica]|uniref:Methyltransferase DDB_G0268948 n=1 Tax=Aplysia californica TaxID=6500 RepID=A0ABM1VYW8_APLCA|nr:putative methyltransferase DDB_G0268948 [Aplysia californica]
MSGLKLTEHYAIKDVADAYDQRLNFSQEVFDKIHDFCEANGSEFLLAVDVCCGPGNSTVIGFDVSEEQLAHAPKNLPNVQFQVANANDMSFLESNSVDLVTVAMALHWLDLERFYREVDRVLKPGGVLIIYNYSYYVRLSPPQAQKVHEHYSGLVLDRYYESYMDNVRDDYRRIALPYPGWKRNDDLNLEREFTLDGYLGYLNSISLYDRYSKEQNNTDFMADIYKAMEQALREAGMTSKDSLIKASWPLFMLMGQKPRT